MYRNADHQQSPVFAVCGWCGGEVYLGQRYYEIDSQTICPDCLPLFARVYFLSGLRVAMLPGALP